MDEKAYNYDEKAKKDNFSCIYTSIYDGSIFTFPNSNDIEGVIVNVKDEWYRKIPNPHNRRTFVSLFAYNSINIDSIKCEGYKMNEGFIKGSWDNYKYNYGHVLYADVIFHDTIDVKLHGIENPMNNNFKIEGSFPDYFEVISHKQVYQKGDDIEFWLEPSVEESADSIEFLVGRGNNVLKQVVSSNQSKFTFSSNELELFSQKELFLQINAYKIKEEFNLSNSNKKILFINQRINKKIISIQ